MTTELDRIIWRAAGQPDALERQKVDAILNSATPEEVDPDETVEKKQPSTKQFRLPKGFEINLFASEQRFPIANAMSLTFDPKGRLWVATMPSYPHYYPGSPPDDKLIILEDTDSDGIADKHTVFADKLYLPTGFELGDGGVYVAAEPYLMFLQDVDGDDVADLREIVLHGFGTEDSHHAISAFTWGQDGALYFHEGVFLNSQVETPYGPVRLTDGSTFRYEPRTQKVDPYISYRYHNPWGNVFTRWGTHLIGDASDGKNYYAPPMTGAIKYPLKHSQIEQFPTSRVRPTAGIEIISSRHFPDHMQGNFLVNNNIGFQGTKQHKVMEKGSGLTAVEVTDMLQSSDENFRPVDLQFGPDGALYIVDWFNPLIGHMQFSLRDPRRDHSHGRIWRITYRHKPLLKPQDLTRQDLPQLLENLKAPEDRIRYRTRIQLREFPAKDVVLAVTNWMNKLDQNDQNHELHRLEALWVYQQFDTVNIDLLKQVLQSKDFRARAAATRVLFYWRDRIDNVFDLLKLSAGDPSPRVRLEASVALSYYSSMDAVNTLLDMLRQPTDYYLSYAIDEAVKHLKPIWREKLIEDPSSLVKESKTMGLSFIISDGGGTCHFSSLFRPR